MASQREERIVAFVMGKDMMKKIEEHSIEIENEEQINKIVAGRCSKINFYRLYNVFKFIIKDNNQSVLF